MNLSKSKYCNGIQCKKLLWLAESQPEVMEEVANQSVLDNGTEVGIQAKKLFGDYIDIDYTENLSQMIADTQKAIAEHDVVNITEASFDYQHNFCSVDILRKKHDKYEIYEVKSSTEVKDIYREDASYQYYVLTSLGYDVEKVYVVYLNSNYVRQGELDLDQLFIKEDVTSFAKERLKEVAQNIKDINSYMEKKEEPKEEIGIQCMEPYACPCFSYCTKDLEKPNVFDIRGMRNSTKFKWYHKGIYTFEDLFNEKLNEKYLEQIDYEIHDKKPKIEVEKIKEFLETLTFPLYFLDFETFQQAIPMFDGTRPYEQIPFQYSLHIMREPGELEHREFLAEPGIDPRRSLALQLVEDIPQDVCTVAYNMFFEKGVIERLAILYPDLEEHLLNIHGNLKDLIDPFKKRYYYVKEMAGSYSIKPVLPALFPDDPALNYHNLEDVHNGSEAMNAYANMSNLSQEEQQKLRHNLLKYCELDTYAMVKIYEKLKEVVESKTYCKKV